MENRSQQSATARYTLTENALRCSGSWTARHLNHLEKQPVPTVDLKTQTLSFDLSKISKMDTSGAWLLLRLINQFQASGKEVTLESPSPQITELLELVRQSGFTDDELPQEKSISWAYRLIHFVRSRTTDGINMLAFVGKIGRTLARQFIKPGHIRWRQISDSLAEAGYKALAIVGLLSFLLGIVIAYQGGMQLRQYGASLFIADLVGLSMVRELAPLITAIIVAGRTGSAYTAQIGTM